MVMRDRELSAAYARAVYDTALSVWARDLAAFRDSLRLAEDTVRASLEDPAIPFGERQALVDRLLAPDVRQELRNFVYTLVRDGHLPLLDDVIIELRRLSEYGPTVRVAQVTTAVPLLEQERLGIERRIVSRYGSGVDIVWQVDPSIIGGVVIRIGDEVIDDSVATRLEMLRGSLKAGV